MRIPVYARRANPAYDRPILKKSLAYVTEQVESGRAAWVNPLDPAKGIKCREVLYFGEREVRVETVDLGEFPISDRTLNLKFIGPKNPLTRFISNLGPNCPWDWSLEPIQSETIPA